MSSTPQALNDGVDLLVRGHAIAAVRALATAYKAAWSIRDEAVHSGAYKFSWHDVRESSSEVEPTVFWRAVKMDDDGDDDSDADSDAESEAAAGKDEDDATVATASSTTQNDASETSATSTQVAAAPKSKNTLLLLLRYNLALACTVLADTATGPKKQLLRIKAHRLFRDVVKNFEVDEDEEGDDTPSKTVDNLRYRTELELVLLLASTNNQGCLCHELSLFEASTLCASTLKGLLKSIPARLHRREWNAIKNNVALLQRPDVAGAA